jgi:anaerobic magnesium-protoporphyrin IX monomethyl ester cyclase
MKILLLFPPFWEPMMPHLALPSLTAALRARGHEVLQRDLNVELFDYWLSPGYLASVLRRLQHEGERTPAGAQSEIDLAAWRAELAWARAEGRQIIEGVEAAKATVRSPAFYDVGAGQAALVTLSAGLRLASVPYYPAALHLAGFDSPYPADASAAILAATQDRRRNPFIDYYEQRVLPAVRRARPDLIGISLTCQHQVIAAFTLARLARAACPTAHLTLGGKMVTCWRDLLPERPQLMALVDSALYFEGEVALPALADAVVAGQGLACVPNLIYHEGETLRQNPPAPWVDVDDLRTPDFDGLPLDKYLAPERVLPVAASRGCYWRRCAFCNVGFGESRAFRERSAEAVASEIRTLAERHGVRRFFFADEALSPRLLKGLSHPLAGEQSGCRWAGCARFDPGMTAETLRGAYASGGRMLLYGLEAGSQRVLERIGKGTRLEVAQRVLGDGAAAGLWNHVFLFFGFPGETEHEAHETIAFLYRNWQAVHSVCTGTFLLETHARIAGDPAGYGVSDLKPPPRHDLAFYYDYAVSEGLSAEQAEAVEERFLAMLPGKRRAHAYAHDIYRFLYACDLEGSGPMPPLLGPERV